MPFSHRARPLGPARQSALTAALALLLVAALARSATTGLAQDDDPTAPTRSAAIHGGTCDDLDPSPTYRLADLALVPVVGDAAARPGAAGGTTAFGAPRHALGDQANRDDPAAQATTPSVPTAPPPAPTAPVEPTVPPAEPTATTAPPVEPTAAPETPTTPPETPTATPETPTATAETPTAAPGSPTAPADTDDGPAPAPTSQPAGDGTDGPDSADSADDSPVIAGRAVEFVGDEAASEAEISSTVLDATVGDLTAAPHAIAVLDAVVEPGGSGEVVACGEIGGYLIDGRLVLGLRDVTGDGVSGVAVLVGGAPLLVELFVTTDAAVAPDAASNGGTAPADAGAGGPPTVTFEVGTVAPTPVTEGEEPTPDPSAEPTATATEVSDG